MNKKVCDGVGVSVLIVSACGKPSFKEASGIWKSYKKAQYSESDR
ncbi:hypothetical protein ACEQPO_27490 [Bacillus sp. SL00103]